MARSGSRSKRQKTAERKAAEKQRAENRAEQKAAQQRVDEQRAAKKSAADHFAAISPTEDRSFRSFWTQLTANRFGTIGCGLSLLAVLFHGIWMGMIAALSASGQAELPEGAWQLYVIIGLVIVGMLTTAIALFLSLYGAIHGRPKVLAYIGLCVSFFVGMFTTLVLLLQASAPR